MSSDINGLRELIEQRERDLQTSERRFCSLINNNADGIIIVDSSGCLRFMNLAAESLFGRSAAELIGAEFGFPIVDGETTEIDVVRRGGKTITAARFTQTAPEKAAARRSRPDCRSGN